MKESSMNNKYYVSIDILKALAVLLIINHRMPTSYVDLPMLATGGALGCSLFFFISGYTLYTSTVTTFSDWMKSRLCRLYPAIWTILTIKQLLFSNANVSLLDYICAQSYWFIECIIIFYLLFYWVCRWWKNKLKIVIMVTLVVYVLMSLWFADLSQSLYDGNRFKYVLFFNVFMLGALCRQHESMIIGNKCRGSVGCYSCKVILLMMAFYLTYFVPRVINNEIVVFIMQFVLFFFLAAWVFYMWVLFKKLDVLVLSRKVRIIFSIARVIAMLSLECFLVQSIVTREIETVLLNLYPLNIPIVFLVVLLQAYVLRCVTRFFFGLVGANEFSIISIFTFSSKKRIS